MNKLNNQNYQQVDQQYCQCDQCKEYAMKNNNLDVKFARMEFEYKCKTHDLTEEISELQKQNKDLNIMLKLSEDEKIKNKQINEYELKLKKTKLQMMLEDIQLNFDQKINLINQQHEDKIKQIQQQHSQEMEKLKLQLKQKQPPMKQINKSSFKLDLKNNLKQKSFKNLLKMDIMDPITRDTCSPRQLHNMFMDIKQNSCKNKKSKPNNKSYRQFFKNIVKKHKNKKIPSLSQQSSFRIIKNGYSVKKTKEKDQQVPMTIKKQKQVKKCITTPKQKMKKSKFVNQFQITTNKKAKKISKEELPSNRNKVKRDTIPQKHKTKRSKAKNLTNSKSVRNIQSQIKKLKRNKKSIQNILNSTEIKCQRSKKRKHLKLSQSRQTLRSQERSTYLSTSVSKTDNVLIAKEQKEKLFQQYLNDKNISPIKKSEAKDSGLEYSDTDIEPLKQLDQNQLQSQNIFNLKNLKQLNSNRRGKQQKWKKLQIQTPNNLSKQGRKNCLKYNYSTRQLRKKQNENFIDVSQESLKSVKNKRHKKRAINIFKRMKNKLNSDYSNSKYKSKQKQNCISICFQKENRINGFMSTKKRSPTSHQKSLFLSKSIRF